MSVLYSLIVLLGAALAAFWGFRKGFSRQVPSLIGLAFGIISARLFGPAMYDILYGAFPSAHSRIEENFVYDTTSRAFVFIAIYYIFKTITFFLSRAFKNDEPTILNNIGGSLLSMFKYLLAVSIFFNFLVAVNLDSALLKAVKSDDGNAVEEVLLLSPALFGGENILDLSHKLQLEEAKKIS